MGTICEQIPKVMADIGAIGKGKENKMQGYKYGVFTVPEVLSMEREERKTKNGGVLIYTILKVKYTFFASDGSNIISVMVGEAMDSGDKSCNKAMSAAQKYAFLQIFSIPTEESKDSENDTPEPTPKEEEKPPHLLISTLPCMIDYLEKASSLEDLKVKWGLCKENKKVYVKKNEAKLIMAKDKRKDALNEGSK